LTSLPDDAFVVKSSSDQELPRRRARTTAISAAVILEPPDCDGSPVARRSHQS
jgi:hypothetical protein